MGEVYRAKDTRLGREVAVKIVPPAFALDPERLRRFTSEAQAVAALNHPNILAIHDIGSEAGSQYLVMGISGWRIFARAPAGGRIIDAQSHGIRGANRQRPWPPRTTKESSIAT